MNQGKFEVVRQEMARVNIDILVMSEPKLNSTFRKLRSWHLVSSLHGKKMSKQWKQWLTLLLGAPKSLQMVTAAMKLKAACSLEEML